MFFFQFIKIWVDMEVCGHQILIAVVNAQKKLKFYSSSEIKNENRVKEVKILQLFIVLLHKMFCCFVFHVIGRTKT